MATEWAPIDKAARALGVSARTLKRRVALGVVTSKLEKGRRLVAVPAGSVPIGTLVPQNGTVGPVTKGQTEGQQGQVSQGHAGTEGPNGLALLVEQRDRDRAEIAFLRGIVEQHQRSEAELRQSLREALRAMPKAITAGQHSPSSVENAQNGPQDGAAGYDGPSVSNEPESGENRSESGLSYGDIADWLEQEAREVFK